MFQISNISVMRAWFIINRKKFSKWPRLSPFWVLSAVLSIEQPSFQRPCISLGSIGGGAVGLSKFVMVVINNTTVCLAYCLPLKVVLNQSRSSIQVVFSWTSSSIKVCFPSKVIFHGRLSSIKCCVVLKVVFLQRWRWQTDRRTGRSTDIRQLWGLQLLLFKK